jgi:hypothetical protein
MNNGLCLDVFIHVAPHGVKVATHLRLEICLHVPRLLGTLYSITDGVTVMEKLFNVERNVDVRAGGEDSGSYVGGEGKQASRYW